MNEISKPHSGFDLEREFDNLFVARDDGYYEKSRQHEQAITAAYNGLLEQLEAAERKLAGVTSKTALDVVAEKMAAEDRARELKEQKEALLAGLNEALDIIVWMSGSPSFSPEGEAHEGWKKARDQLDRLFQLAARHESNPAKEPTIEELDRLDDEAIAEQVRERDATDTGERLTLEELADEVGIDLSEVSNQDTRSEK